MNAYTKGYWTALLVIICFTLYDIYSLLQGNTVSDWEPAKNLVLALLSGIGIGLGERDDS